MDMNDHLNMEKDLKLFVYPSENGFKIPKEDDNVAYFVKNLYQSPYPHNLSKFAINNLENSLMAFFFFSLPLPKLLDMANRQVGSAPKKK